MAIKKVEIVPPGYTDVLYPKTSTDMVISTAGKTVETHLSELEKGVADAKKSATDSSTTALADAKKWAQGYGVGATSVPVFTGNLNTLKTGGSYYAERATSAPTETDGTGFVFVEAGSATDVKQTFVSMHVVAIPVRVRMFTGGRWSDWTELETVTGSTTKFNKALKDAKDYTDTAPEALRRALDQMNKYKRVKDSIGEYTVVEYKRPKDLTMFAKSTLSGGTSPRYTTRTVVFYGTNGTTVQTDVWKLTYDDDDVCINEVLTV